MRAGFSIRTKLLLVAMLLLLIPWMSYVYVRDMKSFLLSGQEDALSLTSRAVSTVLHDRPELFSEDSKLNENESQENEIYAYPLPNYISLNGDFSDWGEQAKQAIEFQPLDKDGQLVSDADFRVKHLLGYRERFIYALFSVIDEEVVFRDRSFLRIDKADHIRLTLQDPDLPARQFSLVAGESGRMSIYLMDDNWQLPTTGQPNYDLAAELRTTDNGYDVELRIPRFLLTADTGIKLSVADVDSFETFEVENLIATTPQTDTDDFSRLLVQSPEIAKILKGLDRADTRIWVVDKDKRVRTVVGNLITNSRQDMLIKPQSKPQNLDDFWYAARYYYQRGLQKIFGFIVDKQALNFADHQDNVEQRNDEIINQALIGKTIVDRRPSIDNQGTILMSAHPVYLGDEILGAVIVEQSTNQVLKQQQDVLENVISVTLIVLLAVVSAMLLFASRLTLRIRRLRNATDNAIDRDGRIVNQKLQADAKSGDEIGDLSRSVSNMLGRLSQYTNYLKGLPDTLAHEVSNPLNVVNSSLHNLSQEYPDVAESKYLDRAKNGVNRIGSILHNLTEAANLEQAMQSETRETFDLAELLESYVDGYSFSHPDQKFELVVHSKPLMIDAAPDYIAQLLDKLVDNAIDFAAKDTAIVVRARRVDEFAELDVINQGSNLPEGMSERIFEPLVSLGRKDAQKSRLGMGLYIVKLISNFHGGEVHARNLQRSNGVIFTVRLPIDKDYQVAYKTPPRF